MGVNFQHSVNSFVNRKRKILTFVNNTHEKTNKTMVKKFMLVTWTLYGLQVLFAVVSLIAIGFFCFSFEWFDLVISIFFMAVSRHVYWLKLKYKKQFVEGVTNFTKHGAFGNLNRRGRKTMERYFKKLRKFNR